MRSYDFPTQVKIVCATMVIHNFIRRTSISDRDFLADSDADDDGNDDGDEEFSAPPLTTSSDMTSLRDFIRDQIVYYSRVH